MCPKLKCYVSSKFVNGKCGVFSPSLSFSQGVLLPMIFPAFRIESSLKHLTFFFNYEVEINISRCQIRLLMGTEVYEPTGRGVSIFLWPLTTRNKNDGSSTLSPSERTREGESFYFGNFFVYHIKKGGGGTAPPKRALFCNLNLGVEQPRSQGLYSQRMGPDEWGSGATERASAESCCQALGCLWIVPGISMYMHSEPPGKT